MSIKRLFLSKLGYMILPLPPPDKQGPEKASKS